MNTLTYNSVNNRYYTTNAVVNGYNLTPIEADSMIVEAPIKLKEKVFNCHMIKYAMNMYQLCL